MIRTAIVVITAALCTPAQTLTFESADGLAHFVAAQPMFEGHNYQAAATELDQALKDPSLDPRIAVWAHTEIAAILDIAGQLDRARDEYYLVLSDPSSAGTAARAFAMRRMSEGHIVSPLTDVPNFGPSLSSVLALVASPTSKAQAEYSAEARVAELEGTVAFSATVAVDGSVQDLKILQPLGLGLDEAATSAAKRWSFYHVGPLVSTSIKIDFILPAKVSRWHLIGVTFNPADGVARPHFLTTSYPPGAGVSNAGFDEAGFVAYTKRQAVVKLAFEIDASGHPAHFQIPKATFSSWGPEAVAIVRRWRFSPGMKEGVAFTTPCAVTLVWANKEFTHESIVSARKTAGMLVELDALRK